MCEAPPLRAEFMCDTPPPVQAEQLCPAPEVGAGEGAGAQKGGVAGAAAPGPLLRGTEAEVRAASDSHNVRDTWANSGVPPRPQTSRPL